MKAVRFISLHKTEMNRLGIIFLVSIFLLALSPVGFYAILFPAVAFLLCEDKNKILKKLTKTKKNKRNLILSYGR